MVKFGLIFLWFMGASKSDFLRKRERYWDDYHWKDEENDNVTLPLGLTPQFILATFRLFMWIFVDSHRLWCPFLSYCYLLLKPHTKISPIFKWKLNMASSRRHHQEIATMHTVAKVNFLFKNSFRWKGNIFWCIFESKSIIRVTYFLQIRVGI